jgi:hypothetical protein
MLLSVLTHPEIDQFAAGSIKKDGAPIRRRITMSKYVRSLFATSAAIGMTMLSWGVGYAQTNVGDIVGAYHYSPRYTLQSWPPPAGEKRDVLNEGADQLLLMGTHVIRVGLNASPAAFYGYTANPGFPWVFDRPPEERIREIAKSPQYDALFHKPFTTFLLSIECNVPVMVHGASSYEDIASFSVCGASGARGTPVGAPLFDDDSGFSDAGFTDAEAAIEKAAIQNLATYLLTIFATENKTFVFGTGEGDWIAREPQWGNYYFGITTKRKNAMIKWLNARQDGIIAARAAVPGSMAHVYGAAEVNFVREAIQPPDGYPPSDAPDGHMITLTNDVLPYLHCDLYSLTAYGIDNDPTQLIQQLDYVATKAPPSASFPGRNVFVAEYAVRENDDNGNSIDGGSPAKETIRRLTEAALGWGARYVLFWEVFDSSILPQFTIPDNTMPTNNQMSGDWLVRTDGSRPPLYSYYQALMTQTLVPIALRTYGGAYVSAAYGGGGAVYVNAPQNADWENLTIVDRNGGALNSGDQINVLTRDGHYLMALYNGGDTVDASSTHPEAWETFTIWKTNGAGSITFGAIGGGDSIAIQAGNGNYFVAEGGGTPQAVFSDPLNANRTAIGAWEQFGLVLRNSVPANCTSYSISPSSTSATSQSGSINVTITGSPSGCTSAWAASGNGSWITVSPQSGGGSGPVTVSWTQNTSTSARSGSATIGGATFSASQSGAAIPNCTSYSLSPSSAAPNDQSGSVNVTVTGSPAGCASSWAASGSGSWITVSPQSGSGSGFVTVSWTQNTSPSTRSGSATIAGATFSVSQSGAPTSVNGFYLLTPCRLIDTRDPNGPYGGPALAAGAVRNILATGQCGIPSGVTALSVNVAVVAPELQGWLELYPGPSTNPRPYNSSINFNAHQVLSNNGIIPVGPDGSINVLNAANSATPFIIDVNGYFK